MEIHSQNSRYTQLQFNLHKQFRQYKSKWCGPGSSADIAADYGLEVPGSNSGRDEIFRPSRPALRPVKPPVKWVPVFSGGRGGRGIGLTPTPSKCRGPRKSRAIPLLTLRACVAYKMGEPYLPNRSDITRTSFICEYFS
jgi:hypothetical protein